MEVNNINLAGIRVSQTELIGILLSANHIENDVHGIGPTQSIY